MEPRGELISKARELERGDQLRSALDLYLRIASLGEGAPAGPIWARTGELRTLLGDLDAAAESYDRALNLFIELEQFNNAILVCRKLLQVRPEDEGLHLTFGELSLRKGYRAFAREGVSGYLTRTPHQGITPRALDATEAFLKRYPDEMELWRDWVAAVRDTRGSAEAGRALELLRERATAAGLEETAARIYEEMRRLDPDGPARRIASDTTDHPPPGSERGHDEAGRIAPLAGLEPTHARLDGEDASAPDAAVEPLPLLDLAGDLWEGPDPPKRGESAGEVSDEDVEPLPLLDLEAQEAWLREAETPEAGSEGRSGPEREQPSPPDPAESVGSGGLDLRRLASAIRAYTDRDAEAPDGAAHYDLGLAYRKVGLRDDALAHFAAALEAEYRPLAVLEVVGEMFVDEDNPALAATLLTEATASLPDPGADHVGLLYWAGRSAQALGDEAGARAWFARVVDIDPSFRDASQRLATLGSTHF